MNRLLVRGAQPGPVAVEGPAAHYLVHVLRLGAGDALEVFDGEGTSFEARVDAAAPAHVALTLGAGRQTPSLRPVTVLQGLPKGDKLELVLQKGTELGASAFVPALCERTVVKLEGKAEQRLARWQRIVEEAARQCARADVPTVHPAAPLAAAAQGLAPGTAVFVLDEEERAARLSHALAQRAPGQTPVALVVGPEGGLTRAEVGALVAAGAVAVTLGPHVLRTETAALAALSVVRHLDGVLG